MRPPPSARLAAEMEAIVAPPIDLSQAQPELDCYSRIDAAHIVMLHRSRLISTETASALARAVREFAREAYQSLDGREAPRGLYIAYQDEIAGRAGAAHTAYLHTGRSRNDLNATVVALLTRASTRAGLDGLDAVRAALLHSARRLGPAPLPLFSQYQVAAPGQAWHYFASVEAGLVQMRKAFEPVLDALGTCPLGAGAGAGTSLAIDPRVTAELLGFNHPVDLSLRAVAGWESALLLSGTLSVAAVPLSRIAQDLQLWLTPGIDVADLPDDLTGTSSILPHKRNPYLLEHMKSLAAQVSAASAECAAICLKVPFCNSVEVSGYMPGILRRQATSFDRLCAIAGTVTKNVRLLPGAQRAAEQLPYAAQVLAEQAALAQGTSVSHQHARIAEALRRDGLEGLLPWQEFVGDDLTEPSYAHKLAYGGGPGAPDPIKRLDAADSRLLQDRKAFSALKEKWNTADSRRERALNDPQFAD